MAQPLTDAINALTTYANTVTGASDTTLSDAVATLASGYGGGGGGYTIDDILERNIRGDIVYTGNATDVPLGCFRNTEITSFWGDNIVTIQGNAFEYCTLLKQVYLGGNNSATGNYAVRGCTSLKALRLPFYKSNSGLGGYGLTGCTSLKLLDYGNVNTAQFNTLPSCPLDTVILRKTGNITALSSSTALNNSTAFKSGGTGGKVYVPQALISTYQTAENWSTYVGYGTLEFVALEGSPYEQVDFYYEV